MRGKPVSRPNLFPFISLFLTPDYNSKFKHLLCSSPSQNDLIFIGIQTPTCLITSPEWSDYHLTPSCYITTPEWPDHQWNSNTHLSHIHNHTRTSFNTYLSLYHFSMTRSSFLTPACHFTTSEWPNYHCDLNTYLSLHQTGMTRSSFSTYLSLCDIITPDHPTSGHVRIL